MQTPQHRFSREFTLVWIAQFTFFLVAWTLIPTLPIYLKKLRATDLEIGILIGTMSLASVISRPLAGRALIKAREKTFMMAGAFLYAVCSVSYIAIPPFWPLVPIRILQGAGLGLFHTSTTTYVANSTEPNNRPRALAHLIVGANLASAIAPSVGMVIANRFGFAHLFLVCTAGSLGVLLVSSALGGDRKPVSKTSSADHGLLPGGKMLQPAIIGFIAFFIWGSMATFYPLYATSLGLANPGFFFTAVAIMFILTRALGDKILNMQNREAVVASCIVLSIVALLMLWLSITQVMFLAVAVLWGIGQGFLVPSLLALALDRSSSPSALVVATVYTSFDTGQFLGPLAMGVVAQYLGYSAVFFCLPIIGAISLLCLWYFRNSSKNGQAVRVGARKS
jgi:predicted MFS family arabinose efflux permease